jgi:hypothetical protein
MISYKKTLKAPPLVIASENENRGRESDSSTEDNILQEDSKATPSVIANVDASTNDATKDELIH